MDTYYNMTVWILVGNYSFTIAAGLIRLYMPGVKKSGTVYWKFQQSLVSKATLQPSIMFADSLLICFIAVEIIYRI